MLNNNTVEIPRVFCFADDNTSVGKLSLENIRKIEKTYENFEKCSGLVLNKSKSELLLFNTDDNLKNQISTNTSFKVVDKIKTLRTVINLN